MHGALRASTLDTVPANLFRVLTALATAGAFACACRRAPEKAPPPVDAGGSTLAQERGPAEDGDAKEEARPSRDPIVYVDGVARGVLAYLELPRSLPTAWRTLKSGRVVRRFRIGDLLESLGAPLGSVKQVHLYGGRDRISIIDGAELARMADDLLFSFTQSDRGKPRIHYPDQRMNAGSRIDLVTDVAVYVQREPPRSEGKYQRLTAGDGRVIEGIPYSGGERPGGTRIYVDGALRTFIKRRTLAAPAGEDGGSGDVSRPRSVREHLETLGVQWRSVKAMELLGDGDVLACLDAASLASAPPLTFTLPRRSRGFVAVDLPEIAEPVRAILLYTGTSPLDRADRGHPGGKRTHAGMQVVGGGAAPRCARVAGTRP